MLLDTQGLRILNEGHWESAASRATAELLATRRWALDAEVRLLLMGIDTYDMHFLDLVQFDSLEHL